jgi:hypothetical protein
MNIKVCLHILYKYLGSAQLQAKFSRHSANCRKLRYKAVKKIKCCGDTAGVYVNKGDKDIGLIFLPQENKGYFISATAHTPTPHRT